MALLICALERRTLVIPSTLGYGDRAMGEYSGKATKIQSGSFGIKEGKPQPNIFNEIDEKPPDGKLSEEEVAQWFHDEHEREMPDDLFANEDKQRRLY